MAERRLAHGVAGVAEVADYLSSRTGLDFSGARGRWLRDVAFGSTDGGGIADRLLAGDDDAYRSLCAAVTVQESYFFREPVTLAFLRDTVIPELAARTGEIRVWSAGCAGGEEAYSLAMMLSDAGLGARARVLGTDLSAAAVEKAREGVYKSWSLRGVNQAAIDTYFRPEDTRHAVQDRYRQGVKFAEHNLLGDVPDGAPFDVVLCRNVLIYLTPDAVRRVACMLMRALRPGGWLLTGVSDPALDGVDCLERLSTVMGTAYRRADPAVITDERPPAPVRRTQDRPRSSDAASSRVLRPAPAAARPPAAARTETHQWRQPAEQALLQAKPREAERLATEALAVPAERAAAYSVLIRALAADGRLAEAAEAGKRAVEELPVAGELRAVTAAVLLEAGRLKEARAAARGALYLDPESPLAHMVLARAAELMGDLEVALRMRRNADRLLKKGLSR